MNKQKDYYWTTTKDEFIERLKVLNTPYHRDIWNYLRSYIVRGRGDGITWNACYNAFKHSKILASTISINKMSKDLNISTGKIKSVLNDMDKHNYIIKYNSKSGKRNNTNIYVLGFLNMVYSETETNVIRFELYLTNTLSNMSSDDRDKITSLYHRQLGVETEMECITSELIELQSRLFGVNQIEPYEIVKKDLE